MLATVWLMGIKLSKKLLLSVEEKTLMAEVLLTSMRDVANSKLIMQGKMICKEFQTMI